MKNQLICAVLLFGFLVNADVQAASATFDNMPTNNYSVNVGRAIYGPGTFGSGSPASIEGMQFTASTSGYLSSVLAPMTTSFSGQIASVKLSLWSDGGNTPLGIIETSILQVGPVFPAPVLGWNWEGTSFLQQGQKYWMVAQTSTLNATISWQYVPNYLSTNALTASTNDGQQNWNVFYGNGGEMAMSVMVTPVPEPEIYVMLLVGFGLLGWIKKRNLHA